MTKSPKPLFIDFSWIQDFAYVLIDYECGLIEYGYGMFRSTLLEFTLYTKREVAEAIKAIGKVPAYTVLWKQADLNLTDVPTREFLAFEQSKNVYGEVDPAYGKVKEYTELEGEELPGSGLSARQMARVINFLKKNGNYSLSNTQDTGNCQYAAVQRSNQHAFEEVYCHENVQKSQLLQ